MGDPNPIIRSKALEHFRKTVGLEGPGGVQVNVNQQAVVQNTNPRSFEEAMDRIRRGAVTTMEHSSTEITPQRSIVEQACDRS